MANLVALGDNIFEIEAAYILGAQYKNSYIKTVKFIGNVVPYCDRIAQGFQQEDVNLY